MPGTAEPYLKRFEADPQARLALLTCAAALQIDDKTAGEAVELVAKSNGSTSDLVNRVKNLGCVWKEWNGYWHVAEDVRRDLVVQLHRELPETTILKLRDLLARRADARAAHLEPADQVAYHEKLLASLEASFHRLIVQKTAEEGATQLVELWRRLPFEAGIALARSVEYLADEVKQISGMPDLPDEVVFLRGIAAQSRGDKHGQEKHFVKVWRDARHRAQPGFVHAKSAHFLSLLVQDRDPKSAEKALRMSFRWTEADRDRGLLWRDLGELIAKDDDRRAEALDVYRESLELLPAKDQVQVHLAIAALLQKGPPAQSFLQPIAKQGLDHDVPMPEPLFDDVETSPDKLRERVEIEMRDFCLGYVRDRGPTIKTAALVKELYERFFEPGQIWKDEAEFFGHVARLLRSILMDRARNYPTLNLEITQGTSQVNAVTIRAKHYVLDLDEAVTRLQEIYPAQALMIELLFYAGLSAARVAEMIEVSEDTVRREWKFAKAFLFREVSRANAVRKGINLPTAMISRNTLGQLQ